MDEWTRRGTGYWPDSQRKDLHGVFWAEVDPDGSWGVMDFDQDNEIVASGRCADMDAAKRAVQDWADSDSRQR